MDYWVILWSLLISLGINYSFFVVAFIWKTDAFTDITYSLSFSLLSIIFLAWFQNTSLYQILLFVLINLWALRLGSYLLWRIMKIKVDHRFDKMRNSFWRFGLFWTLQAITVFLVALPTVFALSVSQTLVAVNNDWVWLFAILALASLIYEAVADISKFRFYNRRKHPTEFIQTGLWKLSRHPNYFGEICFWYFMVAIYWFGFYFNQGMTTNSAWQLLWVLSPVYLMLTVNLLSGVPLLEIKAHHRMQNDPTYQNYLTVTPCVIPLIGKRGPIWRVKRLSKPPVPGDATKPNHRK